MNTYNLSKRIRAWSKPPALPRPEGWQRCFPRDERKSATMYQYVRDRH